MKNVYSFAIALLVLVVAAGTASAQQVVRDIRVTTRDRSVIDSDTVKAFIAIKEGDELNRDALSRDVKSMEQSGRFSYVAADVERVPDGLAVTYTVEFKPIIRRLTINGAEYLTNKKVRDLLELGVGDPVDDAVLSTKSVAVKDHYRKKYFPFVELSWTITTDPASGGADVSITVKEGARAKVKSINFVGNESVTTKELRKVMKQKKRWMFSWLTGSGRYDPDVLSADVPAIRSAYLDKGFLDVSVGQPKLENVDEQRLAITIPVKEGAVYRLGSLSVVGTKLFEVAKVMTALTNRPGDVASASALQAAAQNLKDYYGSRGYIDTLVTYKLSPDVTADAQGRQVVNVEFTVKEGHLAYIRTIGFRGNSRTRDKVLRRELVIYPGEVVNEVKVRTSERRLKNLGYFSDVSAVKDPTPDPSQYDVNFELTEQKTGQFLVGAGFSSVDNLIGFVELSLGNFDIANWPPVGGGQKLRLRGTVGTQRTDVELNFTEPWFLDRKLALGVSLFRRDARYLSSEYDQQNTGMNVSLAKPLGRFTRITFIYGLENIDISDVDDSASDLIKAEEGSRIKSSLTTELAFDSRDNPFIPTRGLRASLAGMYAGGPLQGETDIYSIEANVSKYWTPWFDHVFSLRGSSSVVDSHGNEDYVPIFDRLFLGGARTLRGFDFREVGPKDENGEPIGGYTLWYASAEYTIPLAKLIRFATFYDIGMVYEDAYESSWGDYNSDVGIGIRFDVPGFPLRFDYAWPLEADAFNDRNSGRFQFSIGYSY